METIWVVVAFFCGFLVKQINLPPLIGYLAAGFALHALGVQPDNSLTFLSDLGVTLLLFTIGLKLNISNLLKPEIWAGAVGHMGMIILLTTINSLVLGYFGFKYFIDLQWLTAALIGFAVAFSSTVCAVKILEDRGEMSSRHGQVAIGILIIQDIAAVVFVSFSAGEPPSLWALTLFLLPLLIPLVSRLLRLSGHGELLPLAGLFLAITGGELFELVGLKAHFGALVIAVLISRDEKAEELAKSLLAFKDLFLIGFFLSIGFTALPTVDMLGVALIMAVALPFKAGLFYLWLTRLKLRSRSAFLTALSLANYSEFGLIVCSVSVSYGLLEPQWLVIMALAVAISFIFSSIVNIPAHALYARWRGRISRFERPERLPEDSFSHPDDAVILVIGMGRVGTGAYDMFHNSLDKNVCGIEVDPQRVTAHCSDGRKVIAADAEDPEFWAQVELRTVNLIMLAMPNYLDIIEVVKQLQSAGYLGKTAGIARYEDEKEKLLASGIDVVFDFYFEAGAGFADQSLHLLE
ncbi:MAG: cation:proton antiporter family protein [bacterium]|nr:potassium transporter Kef [Gammaproteobacteria bacterium]HIL96404.1 potassium transporter Kef [Pseudomonadales bacterium]